MVSVKTTTLWALPLASVLYGECVSNLLWAAMLR